MKFHRFPFATSTRAIIFSESPELDAEVDGPDGKPAKGSHVRVVGKPARYRIVSLDKFTAPGDYKVEIKSGSGGTTVHATLPVA